jgi:tetratricopeptide (TPR) repeat protein
MDSHYLEILAEVRFDLHQWDKALEACLELIERKQDVGRMLDLAARCYFELKDATNGLRYAKQANELGHSHTYRDWEQGKFGRRS